MDYSSHIKGWNDFQVGDYAAWAKTVTDADVVIWTGITGDINPLHLDEQYAATTRFSKPVVPGVFVLGFISTAITRLGMGHVYASQNIRFKKPVFVGDTITGEATIREKVEEKGLMKVETRCVNQNGEVVMDGEAVLYVLKEVKG